MIDVKSSFPLITIIAFTCIIDLVNINAFAKFGQTICPFVLRILSENKILTSIKGCNSVQNLQPLTCNNPNLDLININLFTNLVKLWPIVLKILGGNEILTSIKCCNSVHNLHKLTSNNPGMHPLNNILTKFGQIPSIHSKDIERKKRNWNYRTTKVRNHKTTEAGKVKSSIASLFSKWGHNEIELKGVGCFVLNI